MRKGEEEVGWNGAGMMIMVGDGDDIYDCFVYIPWVIVSLGHPRNLLQTYLSLLVVLSFAYLVVTLLSSGPDST